MNICSNRIFIEMCLLQVGGIFVKQFYMQLTLKYKIVSISLKKIKSLLANVVETKQLF